MVRYTMRVTNWRKRAIEAGKSLTFDVPTTQRFDALPFHRTLRFGRYKKADSAIMSGVSTLIERNQYGSVVRSFLLTQASSNTSVGVNWASFAGSNSDDTLVWRELRTSITASNSTSTFTFNVSITTFGASVRGRIDLGNIEITPRSLETAVKVSGYQYLDASNTLSLRVFCAYGTVGYRTQLGGIASGHSLARVYVSIDDEAQRLSNDTSHSGTNMSVSISAWQILSGLRTSVSKSVMGYMLNDKFGTNWDVIYSDVTLPCPESLEPQYSLFRISMGTGSSTINDTEPDTEIPNYPIHEPAAASTAAPLLCIVILALLAQLLL